MSLPAASAFPADLSSGPDDLLSGLEPAQREVLLHDFRAQGPLLVLAGAGTGKTTVLTRRLALECRQGHGDSILALTFTRKAAEEMRERTIALLPEGLQPPRIRTFHSLGLAILSEEGGQGWKAAGWTDPPRLLSESELALEFSRFWQERFRAGTPCAPSAGEWTRETARWARPHEAQNLSWVEDWEAWEARKRLTGIAEHHDLLAGALEAVERSESVASRWRTRARTVLVDEFQDTDRTQYRLLKALSEGSSRLVAVGDDDQSIYGFRGAEVRNVLDWTEDHPQGRVVALTANHRSFQPILDAANALFPDKPPAFRKILTARRKGPDPLPVWHRARSGREEAAWVLDHVRQELSQGTRARDICVLGRSHRQINDFLGEVALPRGVEIQTIHAAKGLEWPVVFVIAQDRDAREPSELLSFAQDEERRLFYVACTRARDRLHLSCARTRGDAAHPSPRIDHPWMRLVRPVVRPDPPWWRAWLP
ncbi:MAG: ATP-dependent helicase [Fibrobacterota bacterium]|nr:ATP-dependent helicase [Fibrobacterota bacterium]QQS03178.1 MAG: ATP-dependent helicase [Fibrobacterota bacterium]